MKCKACHHLNCSSDAECFMCNAPLYRGAPKVHGAVFFFVALCVFIPVFSATGGVLKLLPYFGVNTVGMRATGSPGLVPIVIGVLGVNVCLLVTRFQITTKEQMLYSGLVALAAWAIFLVFAVGFGKELSQSRYRVTEARPAARTVARVDPPAHHLPANGPNPAN